MATSIASWGSSAGIRIPKEFMSRAGLSLGQRVDLEVVPDGVLIRPSRPKFDINDLVSRITPENMHEYIDFGPSVGREIVDD